MVGKRPRRASGSDNQPPPWTRRRVQVEPEDSSPVVPVPTNLLGMKKQRPLPERDPSQINSPRFELGPPPRRSDCIQEIGWNKFCAYVEAVIGVEDGDNGAGGDEDGNEDNADDANRTGAENEDNSDYGSQGGNENENVEIKNMDVARKKPPVLCGEPPHVPAHPSGRDFFSRMTQELTIRTLSFLEPWDLCKLAAVSHRFNRLSSDPHLWKRLYNEVFIATGFKRFAFCRPPKMIDWKRQFRISHHWFYGVCASWREIPLGYASSSILLKAVDGMAVTVDAVFGLRVWNLKNAALLAEARRSCRGLEPSCLAVEEQLGRDLTSFDICVGFKCGTFSLWTYDVASAAISCIWMRGRTNGDPTGPLIGIAFSSPYVMTATATATVPTTPNGFLAVTSNGSNSEVPDGDGVSQESSQPLIHVSLYASDTTDQTGMRNNAPPVPVLVKSFGPHKGGSPVTLSIRKLRATTIASIVYTCVGLSDWSIGIQEMRLPAPGIPVDPVSLVASDLSPRSTTSDRRRDEHPFPSVLPTSAYGPRPPSALCYAHPYLLAVMDNNTMVRFLCTSQPQALSIAGGRLLFQWGPIDGAAVTTCGKAVTISPRGPPEVWSLVRNSRDESVSVDRTGNDGGDVTSSSNAEAQETNDNTDEWDERNKTVELDDEMIVILRHRIGGLKCLEVVDFDHRARRGVHRKSQERF